MNNITITFRVLMLVLTTVQCSRTNPSFQPAIETNVVLSDDVVDNIKNDFLREKVKMLKAGNKVNVLIDSMDRSLPMLAVMEPSHNLAILQYLQQHGIPSNTPNSYHATALHFALYPNKRGNPTEMLEVIRYLVQYRVLVNQTDQYSRTALHWALYDIDKSDTDLDYTQKVVKLLCEKGARVDVPDDRGETALFLARKQPVIKRLLEAQQ